MGWDIRVNYSLEFKKAAVQKYFTRGNRTVNQILEEVGISPPALYQWRDQLANATPMKNSCPFDWPV